MVKDNQLINSKHLQRFPEPSKLSRSLVHEATQSWEDLLIWQLSRRQSLITLHKEGKPQIFITKEAGCSQSAVSIMLKESWVKEKVWKKKMHKRIVKQNRWMNFGWTSQGIDWGWGHGIESHTHRRVKEFGYSCRQRCLTWAKEKKNWTVPQWSKVLFSDERKFCISFVNQGPRVGGRVDTNTITN